VYQPAGDKPVILVFFIDGWWPENQFINNLTIPEAG
jgi:hypothetical protein